MSENPNPIRPEREEEAAPRQNPGRVPSLDESLRYGGGSRRSQLDDEIERELAEAMGDQNFDQLLVDPTPRNKNKTPSPTPGKLKGKIIRIHNQDVFVEVPGGRSQGVLPMQQFTAEAPAKIGDEVEVTIEGAQDGMLLLSRMGSVVHADWSSIAVGMIVEARVTETNKGGLAVEINHIRGFMPISQIDLYRVEDVEQFVNQKLRCMVTEVDVADKNLVVSRRALLEKERAEQSEKIWAELAEGQVREGIVRNIREFGAFVDLGGVDGLIPMSQLSWSHVEKAEDVVKVGQKVRVMVMKLDPTTRKVSLGLKQLSASPWDDIQERYHPGSVVSGKVSRIADFGAFVQLEHAVEGLIHISELAPQRVFRVKDIVQVDQPVNVVILSVDAAQRRISLSLKAALAKDVPPPEEEEDEGDWTPPQRPFNPNLRGGV